MHGACRPLLLRRALVLAAAALASLTLIGPAAAASRGKPDLVPSRLSARVAPGAPAIVVSDAVRNAGRSRAPATTVRYLLSRDRRANWGDIPLGTSRRVRPLAPGRSSGARRILAPRVFLSARPYYVLACADPLDRVSEGREANNCRTTKRPLLGRNALSTLGPPALEGRPAAVTNQRDAGFRLSHAAQDVRLECSLDEAPFRVCGSVLSLAGLADGRHELSARVRDRLGRAGRTALFAWRVDTVAPEAPAIVERPHDPTNAPTAVFRFASAETAPRFECLLDSRPAEECESLESFEDLSDGRHSLRVHVRDEAGNLGPAASATWVVDTVAPSAPAISSQPPALTRSKEATIAFGATGDGELRCAFDGAPLTACSSPARASGLADGSHTFAVRAVDEAGNASGAAVASWTVDSTGPAPPAIVEAPADPTNRRDALVRFGSEPGATVECSFDAGTYASCSSPWETDGLLDGRHTFRVKATDALGNEGAARTYAWTVDTVPPPAPALTSKPGSPTNSTQATFAFTGTEGFRCELDGVSAACTSPRTYSGLGAGPHTFAVAARDAAGNESAEVSHTWTVDLTAPPVPRFASTPVNPTSDRSASFQFTDSEADVAFRCTFDGVVVEPCASPYAHAAPPLADGLHRFDVAARDVAGNWSAPAVHVWFVDNTAAPAPGLPLGVFRGPRDVAGAAAFSTWLNRPIAHVLDYFEWSSWDSIVNPREIGVWKDAGYSVVFSVPMLTMSGTTLEEGAAGAYDHHWVALAQRLVAAGQEDVVLRIGWEFNGDWYAWSAGGKEEAFKTYWRRIVNAMRSVRGAAFRFDWSPNFGPSRMPADAAYPGDAYVDVIGMSPFDQDWYPGWENPVTRWRNFVTLPYGLQWQYDFARAHGKQLAFDEWGLTLRDDGHGGGDDPYYVEKMFQWFNATDPAWALYFEFDKDDGRHTLMSNQFPNATARFKQLFGGP
jgi:hypothetical protein